MDHPNKNATRAMQKPLVFKALPVQNDANFLGWTISTIIDAIIKFEPLPCCLLRRHC